MNGFLQRHAQSVTGMLCGFDRVRFRGTVRVLANASGLGAVMWRLGILLKDFKRWAMDLSEQLKAASLATALALGRPVRYLASSQLCKEDLARQIAREEKIERGLICVLTAVEPCRSFHIRRAPESGRLVLESALRKCLHLYHYFMHEQLGFCHARVQSWLPFNVHVCINGREWLGRQMDEAADLHRRAQVCQAANQRYLQAMETVEATTPLKQLTGPLCQSVKWKGRSVRGLNPLAASDAHLLESVARGEFLLNGFRNRDLRDLLFVTPASDPRECRRRSGRVTRQIRMLRAHGLIHKVPKTHRYMVSPKGRQAITALIQAREADTAKLANAA